MEIASKIIASLTENEYRPCEVTIYHRTGEETKRALFHKWITEAQVVEESPLRGGHPAGQVMTTLALVEYEDGTVDAVSPGRVRFLDTAEFNGHWERVKE
jgi:hypothetical protein